VQPLPCSMTAARARMSRRGEEATKKVAVAIRRGPQRLKPDLFSIKYVRAKARTLRQPEFFCSLWLLPELLFANSAITRFVQGIMPVVFG
jgi:hypothetical protein